MIQIFLLIMMSTILLYFGYKSIKVGWASIRNKRMHIYISLPGPIRMWTPITFIGRMAQFAGSLYIITGVLFITFFIFVLIGGILNL